MAVQVKAPGNAAPTGAPGFTPPPKAQAPDQISRVRAPTAQSPGQNGPNNPSSIPAGTQLLSDMAKVLKQGQDDGEHVLDKIIGGAARGDVEITSELRPVTAEQKVPTTFGMKGAATGPKIPAKLGDLTAGPVRQPK